MMLIMMLVSQSVSLFIYCSCDLSHTRGIINRNFDCVIVGHSLKIVVFT